VAQHFTMSRELSAALDAWIAAQPDPKPSRPEAIRHLMEIGLQATQGPEAQDGRSDGA